MGSIIVLLTNGAQVVSQKGLGITALDCSMVLHHKKKKQKWFHLVNV